MTVEQFVNRIDDAIAALEDLVSACRRIAVALEEIVALEEEEQT